jgi:non-heme chloroperoxidase
MSRAFAGPGRSDRRQRRLMGVIPPFLLKTDDNPEGVDGQVFET